MSFPIAAFWKSLLADLAQLVRRARPRRGGVSEPARTLLVLARRSGGELCVLASRQNGHFSAIGGGELLHAPNAAAVAAYWEAEEALRVRGLAVAEDGCFLRLTARGWDVAQRIQANGPGRRAAARPLVGFRSRPALLGDAG